MAQAILIVEDEEKIARFIELELLHEGYQVEKSQDGREGLCFIEVKAAIGAREDLGRPTKTPMENKKLFMGYLGGI